MALDALDQKTLNSPHVVEVYDAYGVEVNAVSNEIFALYERAGFLYPEKAARLTPHLKQVRATGSGCYAQRLASVTS